MRRRYLLGICVLLFCLIIGSHCSLEASESKIIQGRAVLDRGTDAARREAISSAFDEALHSYIYDDLGFSHNFDVQVNEKIFQHPRLYIKSYSIQQETPLGDLYQVELRIDLQTALLSRTLAEIEQGDKPRVEELSLLLLPPPATGAVVRTMEGGENSRPDSAISFPALPRESSLTNSLLSELTVYGFKTVSVPSSLVGTLSENGIELSCWVDGLGKTGNENGNCEFSAADFAVLEKQYPCDLLILIQPFPVIAEKIVSLDKYLWKGSAGVAFFDLKNKRTTKLGKVQAKVIEADQTTGLTALGQSLNAAIVEAVVDRLLRDYRIPQEHESRLRLKCRGFRKPSDFYLFQQRLSRLRTVKRLTLVTLAPGVIELELALLIPPMTLKEWIDHLPEGEMGFRLRAIALPNQAPANGMRSEGRTPIPIQASGDTTPEPRPASPQAVVEKAAEPAELLVDVDYVARSGG